MKKNTDYLDLIRGITEVALKVDSLLDKTRKRPVVDGRKIFFLIAKDRTTFTLQELGDYIGGMTHSNVSHSIDKAIGHIETLPAFKIKYDLVREAVMPFRKWQIENTEKNIPINRYWETIIQKQEFKISEQDKLIAELKDYNYTENEVAYRLLTEEKKIAYDLRVSAILKMLNAPTVKEIDKYETILCQD